MGTATNGPKSLLLAMGSKLGTNGVTPVSWKSLGMAMFTPAIGSVVYEATSDAIESSGRMEQPGHGNRQVEMRRDVSQTKIERMSREDNGVLPALCSILPVPTPLRYILAKGA